MCGKSECGLLECKLCPHVQLCQPLLHGLEARYTGRVAKDDLINIDCKESYELFASGVSVEAMNYGGVLAMWPAVRSKREPRRSAWLRERYPYLAWSETLLKVSNLRLHRYRARKGISRPLLSCSCLEVFLEEYLSSAVFLRIKSMLVLERELGILCAPVMISGDDDDEMNPSQHC